MEKYFLLGFCASLINPLLIMFAIYTKEDRRDHSDTLIVAKTAQHRSVVLVPTADFKAARLAALPEFSVTGSTALIHQNTIANSSNAKLLEPVELDGRYVGIFAFPVAIRRCANCMFPAGLCHG
jgi:hypothetical protein